MNSDPLLTLMWSTDPDERALAVSELRLAGFQSAELVERDLRSIAISRAQSVANTPDAGR